MGYRDYNACLSSMHFFQRNHETQTANHGTVNLFFEGCLLPLVTPNILSQDETELSVIWRLSSNNLQCQFSATWGRNQAETVTNTWTFDTKVTRVDSFSSFVGLFRSFVLAELMTRSSNSKSNKKTSFRNGTKGWVTSMGGWWRPKSK